MDPSDESVLKQEVQCLFRLGAVELIPTQHEERGLYSKYFLVLKKEGWMETNYRSMDAEYFCQDTEIQNGDIHSHCSISRPTASGCVFSYHNTPFLQEISTLLGGAGPLPTLGPSL